MSDKGDEEVIAIESKGHKFHFRWSRGKEHELMERIIQYAEDENIPEFDWFVAAALSHQIGRGEVQDE